MQFQREMYWKVKPREYALYAVIFQGKTSYGLWYQSEQNGVEAWQGKLVLFDELAEALEYCLVERLELQNGEVAQVYDLDTLASALPDCPRKILSYWFFFVDLADRMELEFLGNEAESAAIYDALLLEKPLDVAQKKQLHQILKQGITLFQSVT